jgi:hypothetical protein
MGTIGGIMLVAIGEGLLDGIVLSFLALALWASWQLASKWRSGLCRAARRKAVSEAVPAPWHWAAAPEQGHAGATGTGLSRSRRRRVTDSRRRPGKSQAMGTDRHRCR